MENNIKEIVTETVKRENPLLKKTNKLPGQTFRLPSKGIMYTNGELDSEVKNGEILVYPMATLDEIYLRTPDMLFQGTAIDTVFKRCMPQIKQPLELYSNDVDFLLTCLRKVSYGDHITITHKCNICGDKSGKVNEYSIPLNHFIQNAKEFDEKELGKLNLKLTTGNHITLRPSTFAEMIKIFQINEDNIKTPEEMERIIVETLSSTIKSVDTTTDKEFIKEWLKTLPRMIIEEFSGKLESLNNWGSEFKYTIQCNDCGADQVISTVLNPLYFFILPSNRKTV
jgi:hypothetical protein